MRCRINKPHESHWFDVEADDASEAADKLIDDRESLGYFTYAHDADGGRETVRFYLVEVEGHGELIVRRYYRGISRRGGIKPHSGEHVLKKIANDLGFEGDPKELLAPGWDREETDWK